MTSLTACPEPGCDETAEVSDRSVMPSTDGPVEHAKVQCVTGHGPFRMPLAMLTDEARDAARVLREEADGRLGMGEPKGL